MMVEPILKIGAVVVKPVASHQSPVTSKAQVLILQPIPKIAGEIPAYVLPRGTRQYRDELGQWHDARDASTGAAHATTLEPYTRGLMREIEEEAGVTPEMLARAQVVELGELPFQSRTKGVYPIYWFVVVLASEDADAITRMVPEDALSSRWASLDEINAMASRGEFSPGYVPVIEQALAVVN